MSSQHIYNPSFKFLQLFLVLLALFSLPSETMADAKDAGLTNGFLTARIDVGYRSVTSTEGETARAVEYTSLQTGPVGGLDIRGWKDKRGFSLIGTFEDDADYSAHAELNEHGKIRFWISTESMFHNLEHLPFDPVNRPDAIKPSGFFAGTWVDFEDLASGDDYFLEVEKNQAHVRVKPGNYPAHVNVEYWELERSGKKQLRFIDHAGSGSPCDQCHVRSQSRSIDQKTKEIKGEVDAHLGRVDVIFEQLYREFRDREEVPVDSFGGNSQRTAGDYQHDEDPDSKVVSSTVKLHSSLAGGAVGAASFTIGKRENESDLVDVRKVKSDTDFYKGAADLTWTFSPRWTLNLKYRLLDIDNSNSDTLVSDSEGASAFEVRDNIDLTRASYAARLSYRPSRKITLKGDFERKEIEREHTGPATLDDPDLFWELPEKENVNRARLTLLARPLGNSKLKLRSWYQYLNSDDPAYGASAEDSNEFFVGAFWSPSPRVGLNASFRGLKQRNSNHSFSQVSSNFPNPSSLLFFEEDRRHEKTDVVAGFFWTPCDALTLTLNYGYLRTRTLQDLIFSTQASTGYFVQDENIENSQRVHTGSVGLSCRLHEALQTRIEGHYIDSYAVMDPRFSLEAPVGTPVNSSGLKDASRIDLRQYGVVIGVDWMPVTSWKWSASYSYDDYDDREANYFDGSAQMIMASVSKSW